MKKLIKKITGRIKNDKGQGATEYILLLVVVVALVMMFKGQIKSKIDSVIGDLSGQISDAASPN